MPCGTPFEHSLHRWRSCLFRLFEQAADRCPRDAVGLGDLTQALTSSAVLEDSNPVDIEGPAGRYACLPIGPGASLPAPAR